MNTMGPVQTFGRHSLCTGPIAFILQWCSEKWNLFLKWTLLHPHNVFFFFFFFCAWLFWNIVVVFIYLFDLFIYLFVLFIYLFFCLVFPVFFQVTVSVFVWNLIASVLDHCPYAFSVPWDDCFGHEKRKVVCILNTTKAGGKGQRLQITDHPWRWPKKRLAKTYLPCFKTNSKPRLLWNHHLGMVRNHVEVSKTCDSTNCSTSRYLDDLLNIDEIYFEGMDDQIYP